MNPPCDQTEASKLCSSQPLADSVAPEATQQALHVGTSSTIERFLHEVVQLTPEKLEQGITITNLELAGAQKEGYELSHTKEHRGKPVQFHYRIVESNDNDLKITYYPCTTQNPVLGGEIEIPQASWSPELRERLRAAWKRITIADPILYERHWRSSIVPEPYQTKAVGMLVNGLVQEGAALCNMATATGKTVVGMMTWDRFREFRMRLYPERKPGKMLFIVNRNMLLREAEEKLEEMYPGKYITGRIYDGEFNVDADVIFATRSSLLETRRLNRLIRSGAIDLIVYDETHHLPAPETSRLFSLLEQASEKHGWNTAVLGLSATIRRRDERSVIRFFNRDVTFIYPKMEAYRDGNLVGIEYVPADIYLDRSFSKYESGQLPRIWETYKQEVARSVDDRALFICPSIPEADRLASFFNSQEGHGSLAVALHSDSQSDNPALFADSYHAWKHGSWPENSRFRDRAEPKVIMAVDMFGEGIDVPEIHNLFLWGNVASSAPFVQLIGRVLRTSPYKMLAKVVDLCGAYRNDDILKHLESVSPMVHWRLGDRSGTSIDEVQPEVEASVAVDSTNEDLPEHLAYLFGNYDSIPRYALTLLDSFLDKKLAEGGVTPEVLAGLESELVTRVTPSRAKDIRELLKPLLFDKETILTAADDFIPRTKGSLISFLRIVDRIFHDSDVEFSHRAKLLAVVLPEFDAKYEELLRQRSRNLKTLRHDILKLNHEEMSGKLLEAVSEVDDTIFPESFKTQIKIDTLTRHKEDRGFFLRSAEGLVERIPVEARSNLVTSGNRERSTTGADEAQRIAIPALLLLPELQGRLQSSDFDLETGQFRELLQERGIFDSFSAQMSYVTVVLKEQMRLVRLNQAGRDEQGLHQAISTLKQVLSPQYIDRDRLWKEFPLSLVPSTAEFVGTLIDTETIVSSSQLRDLIVEVREILQDGITRVGARQEEPLAQSANESVIVSLTKQGDFSVLYKSFDPSTDREIFRQLCTLENVNGYFGRGMVNVIPSSELTSLAQVSSYSMDQVAAAVMRCLQTVETRWGKNITYVLPAVDQADSFVENISNHLRTNGRALIAGARSIPEGPRKKTASSKPVPTVLGFTIEGALQSSLPYVGDSYKDYVQRAFRRDNFGPNRKQQALLELEVACYEIPLILNHRIPEWQKKMASFKRDPVCGGAIRYLQGSLDKCTQVLGNGEISLIKVLGIVDRILEKSDTSSPGGESAQMRIISTALNEMVLELRSQDVFKVRGSFASSLVPEDIALLAPILRDWNVIRFFQAHGHRERFEDISQRVERVLRGALTDIIKNKRLSDQRKQMLTNLTSALTTEVNHTKTLLMPTTRAPTLYYTQVNGELVVHKGAGCPAAVYQDQIEESQAGDGSRKRCPACFD